MKIINFKVFEGKNIYSLKKCIRLNIDLEGYCEIPSKDIHDFNSNLVNLLPELAKHRCGIDEDLGFIKRLIEGTYLAHISEHIIIALHNMIGVEISYGKSREISGDNYYVIYQYEYRNTGIEAANISIDLINSLISNETFDLNFRLNRLKEVLISEQLGANTVKILSEARKRGIPILGLNENNMIQLGYGKYSYTVPANLGDDTSGNDIADDIIEKLFKNTSKSIPLVAVTGTNGKTTTTRLIAHILTIEGYKVGMTTTSGIYIDGECIYKGDTTGPKSALTVLTNKDINAAVLETARGGIIREGLAYDLADVGVITNITEDHLGLDEIENIEALAKVKALIGEAVKQDGYVVINGDDKICISILNRFKSKLIIFSNNKNNEVMRLNINNGGYGIYVDEGNIIIQRGTQLQKLLEVKDIGIAMRGILKYNIENAMAACATAVGLGISYDTIKTGLMSFYCNQDQNPGRFNVYFVSNIMVILDYGHNIEGYKCVLDGIKHIEHRKLIGVIGVPGDRLDNDILKVGKCAGENFDYIFIKEDADKRGRAKGEVATLLEKGILNSKFYRGNMEKILDEAEAFKTALDFAEPEDIVIIFFEKSESLLEIMKSKNDEIKSPKRLLVGT